MRWVMVDEVAQRLKLDEAAVDSAIRQAEAKGLLVSEGGPPHSVCLKSVGGFGSRAILSSGPESLQVPPENADSDSLR